MKLEVYHGDGGTISHCYNVGSIFTNKNKNCNIRSGGISIYGTLNYCYYLKSSGAYNISKPSSVVQEKTMEEMKSQQFVDLLNENHKKDNSGFALKEWKYEENLYPYFETFGENTIFSNKKLNTYTIIKKDIDTGEPIPNVSFDIYYSNNSEYRNLVFKFNKTTNKDGKIVLNLPVGYYKAIERKTANGYILDKNENYRTIYFKVENDSIYADVIEINYIEDLIELSNNVKNGDTYKGKIVVLKRSLDFNDKLSYKDSTTKIDYNNDGNEESLIEELTNQSSSGFIPIGVDQNNYFAGTFDGNGFEIKNLHINVQSKFAALFGYIDNADIKNLGVSGNIMGKNNPTAGIAALTCNSVIENCFNEANIQTQYSSVGGIVGQSNNTQIINCYNIGTIEGNYGSVAGIVSSGNSSEIINCYNIGKLLVGNYGGVAGIIYSGDSATQVKNCYNAGEFKTMNTNIFGITYSSSVKVQKSYYIKTENITGVGGKTDITSNTEAKTIEQMKDEYFVEKLNENSSQYYSSNYLLKSVDWIYNPIGYPKLGLVQKEIILYNIKDEDNFVINKVDENNIPIENVKFAIYNLDENDFAKDKFGRYIGNKNSDGIYEVVTNKNGKIELNLPDGYYKAVETKSVDGYILEENESARTTYFIVGKESANADLTINSIEDLIDLSEAVSKGTSYEGKTIKLLRDLDFNDDESYDDPTTTKYGNYNGDDITQGIKDELTSKNGTGFKPIGYSNPGTPFRGTFNGNGHEIKNLYINCSTSSWGVGFFGIVWNGTIMNLGLTGEGSINGFNTNPGATGALVGHIYDNGKVINCYNKLNVTGNSGCTAGIVGNVYSSGNAVIENCYNEGIINGPCSGGIIGNVYNATISNCYNIGNISSTSGPAGGIAFILQNNCNIYNCYNIGNVTSSIPAGGITYSVSSNSTIKNCYNTGIINGEPGTGAISVSGSIQMLNNCYYLLDSSEYGFYGQEDMLGRVEKRTNEEIKSPEFQKLLNNNIKSINSNSLLVDWIYEEGKNPTLRKIDIIKDSEVTITNKKAQGVTTIKKLDQDTNEPISGVEFTIYKTTPAFEKIDFAKASNGNYIGKLNSDKLYVVTTDNNGEINLELPDGHYKAIEVKTADGYEQDENEFSRTTNFIVGGGTPSNIEINYIEDLVDLSEASRKGENFSGKVITLKRNLDFKSRDSYRNPDDTNYGDYNGDKETEGIMAELINEDGCGFKPIGTSTTSFRGVFNGNGCSISNLYINSSEQYVGLFGQSNGKVLYLSIKGGNVKSSNTSGYVGSIAGYCVNSYLVINECSNSANVTGNIAGGITGYISGSRAIVSNSYNTGEVHGRTNAGGILGLNSSQIIINCYNKGNIKGESGAYKGGIAGTTSGSWIFNCYNVGIVQDDTYSGGIVGNVTTNISGFLNYYSDNTAHNGVSEKSTRKVYNFLYNIASKSNEEMKLKEFSDRLNNNMNLIDDFQELTELQSLLKSGNLIINKWQPSSDYPELIQTSRITNSPITIYNKKANNCIITKLDKNTNQPIKGVKFSIYSLTDDYKEIGFAKYANGNYIGTLENSKYIVTTDENGKINLRLPDGYYKAVEVGKAEGYYLEQNEYANATYFKVGENGKNAVYTINYIEDLVDFSNDVNNSPKNSSQYPYMKLKVDLLRTLDFEDENSYRNPNDKSYDDYNGDEIVQGIKDELTNKDGCGFKPIGTSLSYGYYGGFDGNGYEIKNIYINSKNQSVGLFGVLVNTYSYIRNLGLVGGNVIANHTNGRVGGILGR